MADDFGFQPAAPSQPQSNDLGFQPSAPPKAPDTSGIEKTVQTNLAQPQTSDSAQPQTDQQRMDTGLGMPVKGVLTGNAQLTPDMRGHLVDAYKNGTATTPVDFMQSALPAAVNASSSVPDPSYSNIVEQAFVRGFKANLEAVKQTGQTIFGQTPEQAIQPTDNVQKYLTAPYQMGWPDFKKIIGKTVYGLTEGAPEIGAAVAGGTAGIAAAGGPEDPAAALTGPIGSGIAAAGVHYAKELAPAYAEALKENGGDQEKAWQAAKIQTGIGAAGAGISFALFGYQPFESAVKNVLTQAFAVQPIAGAAQQAATNIATGQPLAQGVGQAAVESGAGAAVPLSAHVLLKAASNAIPGHEALKPVVGDAIGKDPSQVTPQDINQTIASGVAKMDAPKAQDFHDVAAVMNAQRISLPDAVESEIQQHENAKAQTTENPYQIGSDGQGGHTVVDDQNRMLMENPETGEVSWTPNANKASSFSTPEEATKAAEQANTNEKDLSDFLRETALRNKYEKMADDGEITIGQFNSILDRLSGNKNDVTDTLHQTYAETGVHPDQVFEDARNNPEIARDINAGRIPSAYDELRGAKLSEDNAPLNDESGPAYSTLPKEPTRLIDWVKKQGGILDTGGDISASIGGAKGRPGLISKNGVDADTLALRAQESGYLPQGDRPDVNALKNAIREDHEGTPQYSSSDTNAAVAYNDVHNRNSEIDRISNDTGIEAKGKTHTEFWNEVAKHMSVEKQLAETQSMTEAHIEDLKRADALAEEWARNRGEAREPEENQHQQDVVTKGDLWKLPRESLEQMRDETQLSDHEKLIKALGSDEEAKRFNRLVRQSESMDHARADKASKELGEIEDKLTPEQQKLVYGIGETGATEEDLNELIKAHSDITFTPHDDIKDIGYIGTLGIRKMLPEEILSVKEGKSSIAAQAALIRFKGALDELRNRGLNSEDSLKAMAQGMSEKSGMSIGDANDFVRDFVNTINEQGKLKARALGDSSEQSRPATLEDLENERSKENAARRTTEGDGGPVESKLAPADQESVQSGGGQGGGGSEPPGRGGEEPNGRGSSPGEGGGRSTEGASTSINPLAKGYAEDLYNRLHQKLGEDTATDIQSMQRELATKDAIGKDLDEKFYLKKEDSNVKLSDEEQKLYDDKIKPLAEKERALYERASFLGAKEAVPKTEDYVHRIVKGKGHYLDKYDTEFGSDDDLGFGNQPGISETTSSLKEAQFYALQDKDGNRQLKTGEIPKGYKAGDAYKDEDGKEWTIKRAKTQEIENNTDLRYYKSVVGNTEDNIRRLEKTIRNIEFLNSLKYDMQRTGLGVAPESSYHPPDYRQVHIPQLRGWSFNSRIAEVLNDVYDRGGDSILGRINNILIKGMYLNPVPHIENVAYDYISSRGWRNVRGIKGVNYLSQAVKDVAEFTPEYLDVLKNGGALRFPSTWKADFFNKMESQFIKEMQQSKDGLDLAKSWGFDSVPSMANSVFNASQKALWGSSDVFLMAKIRELKDQGMSTVDAIKEAQKHIVDYRIPPRVGEQILGPELSRMLSKSLQNNAIVVFARYHYGLFKALGNSVKDLGVGVKNLDPSLIAKASGQLFATYFLLTVVNPAISNLWSSVMGEKEKMRNPGSTGLMGAILDAVSGEKSLGNALGTQFIVSPGIKVGSDFLTDKIVDPDKGHEGIQLMDYLMKQPTMSIPFIPYNIREGKATVGQEALDQVGVKPDKPYKKRKPSAASKRRLEDEERGLLGED